MQLLRHWVIVLVAANLVFDGGWCYDVGNVWRIDAQAPQERGRLRETLNALHGAKALGHVRRLQLLRLSVDDAAAPAGPDGRVVRPSGRATLAVLGGHVEEDAEDLLGFGAAADLEPLGPLLFRQVATVEHHPRLARPHRWHRLLHELLTAVAPMLVLVCPDIKLRVRQRLTEGGLAARHQAHHHDELWRPFLRVLQQLFSVFLRLRFHYNLHNQRPCNTLLSSGGSGPIPTKEERPRVFCPSAAHVRHKVSKEVLLPVGLDAARALLAQVGRELA
mmetsp:Transcript_36685/g.105469  ORF Transcript_36685/g.105469 Transcript_36685/m.105469 type:complete len:276 (+) Transcript_36685:331-1158(+)